MIKNFALICLAPFLTDFKSGKDLRHIRYQGNDSAKTIIFKISPAKPLIEKDIYGYYLNFDISVTNQTSNALELRSLEESEMDLAGKLWIRKSLNNTGH